MKKLFALGLTLLVFSIAAVSALAAQSEPVSTPEALSQTICEESDRLWENMPELPTPDSLEDEDLIKAADEANEALRQYYLEQGYTEIPAASTATIQSEVNSETYRLAYLDPDKATPEMREKILAARSEIIFSVGWRGDTAVGVSGNVLTKEFKILPKFSELFPDWDLPENWVSPDSETLPEDKSNVDEPVPQSTNGSYQLVREVNTGAPLPVPSSTSLTSDFYQIASTGDANTWNLVEVTVTALIDCAKCNVGFRNVYYPQYKLSYDSNMPVGGYISTAQLPNSCPLFGIRASSSTNTAGSGSFQIKHSIRV